jgi:hypothetical protein
MVASEVRDDVLTQFPAIDRQLELLQGALAHGLALCELLGSNTMLDKLGRVLKENSEVLELLSAVRRDLARFVNPYCDKLLDEGSVDFPGLLEAARAKIKENPYEQSAETMIGTTLSRIKDTQIELGELAHLYKLDYGLLSGVVAPLRNDGVQGFFESFNKRIAPIERLQELLKDSLGPQLRAALGSQPSIKT